jgi:hypothetical protein
MAAATPLNGSDRCDSVLLPQITIESSSISDNMAYLSLITEDNYQQAKAGGSLNVIIEDLPIGASYQQFDEKRQSYHSYSTMQHDRLEARAHFRQSLTSAQLDSWTKCMTGDVAGVRIIIRDDDNKGAAAEVHYVGTPGSKATFRVTLTGGRINGGKSEAKFTIPDRGAKGILLTRNNPTGKLVLLVNGAGMTDTAVSLGQVIPSSPPKKLAIVIAAADFARGTHVAIDQCTPGPGILANAPPCNAIDNVAEFDFDSTAEGKYRLEINYAAATARPVRIILNGAPFREQALSAPTGGWLNDSLRWTEIGTVVLKRGRNTLRLERNDVFPHIHDLRLLPLPE